MLLAYTSENVLDWQLLFQNSQSPYFYWQPPYHFENFPTPTFETLLKKIFTPPLDGGGRYYVAGFQNFSALALLKSPITSALIEKRKNDAQSKPLNNDR